MQICKFTLKSACTNKLKQNMAKIVRAKLTSIQLSSCNSSNPLFLQTRSSIANSWLVIPGLRFIASNVFFPNTTWSKWERAIFRLIHLQTVLWERAVIFQYIRLEVRITPLYFYRYGTIFLWFSKIALLFPHANPESNQFLTCLHHLLRLGVVFFSIRPLLVILWLTLKKKIKFRCTTEIINNYNTSLIR